MKEYNKELKDILLKSKKYKRLCDFSRCNKNLIKILINAISFSCNDVVEMLYCIENNIFNKPKCKTCDEYSTWILKKRKYSSHCKDCIMKSEEVKNKTKNTNIERYGVEVPLQNKEILDKVKQTNIERYGVENVFSSLIIQDKIKNTNIVRYGTEFPLQNKEILDKVKQTNIERYGVEVPIQNIDIKNKVKQTNIERYGFEWGLQSENIKNKTKNTNIRRFGVENPTQSSIITAKRLQTKQTIYHKRFLTNCEILYNKKYIYFELKNSHDLIVIECPIHGKFQTYMYYHMKGIECPGCVPWNTHFSKISIEWLEYIKKENNIHIQHAMNEGEYNIPNTRYKVDGYCKNTNTVYEFLGDYWHGNPEIFLTEDIHPIIKKSYGELYDQTMNRLMKIQELGYNVIYIWENDWLTNFK